jgi:hypothetical protein
LKDAKKWLIIFQLPVLLHAGQIITVWNGGAPFFNSDWNDSRNWTNGVPNNSDTTTFSALTGIGNKSPTISASSVTVDDLTISHNAVVVNNGQTLTLAGSAGNGVLSNDGAVNLSNGQLLLSGAGQTITFKTFNNQTGSVNISEPSGQGIVAVSPNMTLVNNTLHTIDGYGSILAAAGATLGITNSGTISANVSGQRLDVVPTTQITNSGLLMATNGGTLGLGTVISNSINNAGGTISANGGTVLLGSATTTGNVTGGTLSVSNGGDLQVFGGTQSGVGLNSTGGTIELLCCGSVSNGNFNLSGNTVLSLSNSATGTTVDASGLNDGGSRILLSQGNKTTASGTWTNGTAGTIEIQTGATMTSNNLTINNDGAITVANQGALLMSSSNLTLNGGGTLTLAGGSILGQGTNSQLINNGNIMGIGTIQGTGRNGAGLTITNGGTISANAGGQWLDLNATSGLTNTGLLTATNGGGLGLAISAGIDNTGGTISANGGKVQIGSSFTLGNVTGGTLSVSNGGDLQILGGNLPGITLNMTGGTAELICCATVSNGNINLSGNSVLSLGNSSQFNNIIDATVQNNAGSRILLSNGHGATVSGVWNNAAGATIEIQANAAMNTDNLTINNDGAITLGNQAHLNLTDSKLTLNGSGTLTMSGGFFVALASPTQLINSQNIIGTGAIEINGQRENIFDITNHGAITASGGTLTLNPGFESTITNDGLLSATNGAILYVNSGSTDNTNGTITANGGLVQFGLGTGPSVSNGTLNAINGGTLEFVATSLDNVAIHANNGTIFMPESDFTTNATVTLAGNSRLRFGTSHGSFSGSVAVGSGSTAEFLTGEGNAAFSGAFTIDAGGKVVVDSGGAYPLFYTTVFTNNGAIVVNSGSEMDLQSQSTVTLNGSGKLTLAGARIFGIDPTSSLLVNDAGHTIEGNGTIQTGFTNNGTVTVDAGSQIWVRGGQFTNYSLVGTDETLTGGTYDVLGTLKIDGNGVQDNAANITMDGAAAKIADGNGNNGLSAFSHNLAEGVFTLQNGATVNTSAQFLNQGDVLIGAGSSFTSPGYTQAAGDTEVNGTLDGPVNVTGGTLSGIGTIQGSVTASGGIIQPGDDPGELTINGNLNDMAGGNEELYVRLASENSFDQLIVTGTANLGGTLFVELLDGFKPANGDSFRLLIWGASSGAFSNIILPTYSDGEYFTIVQTQNGLTLEFFAPEPASWMLALLGFAALFLAGRARSARMNTM